MSNLDEETFNSIMAQMKGFRANMSDDEILATLNLDKTEDELEIIFGEVLSEMVWYRNISYIEFGKEWKLLYQIDSLGKEMYRLVNDGLKYMPAGARASIIAIALSMIETAHPSVKEKLINHYTIWTL